MLRVTSYLVYRVEKADKCIFQIVSVHLNIKCTSARTHTQTQAFFTASMLAHRLTNYTRLLPCSSFLPFFQSPSFFSLLLSSLGSFLSVTRCFSPLTHTHNHTQLHSDFRLYSNAELLRKPILRRSALHCCENTISISTASVRRGASEGSQKRKKRGKRN